MWSQDLGDDDVGMYACHDRDFGVGVHACYDQDDALREALSWSEEPSGHLDNSGGGEAAQWPEEPPPGGQAAPSQTTHPKAPDRGRPSYSVRRSPGKCRKNSPWEASPRYQMINMVSLMYRRKSLNSDDTTALIRAFMKKRPDCGAKRPFQRKMQWFWALVAMWDGNLFRDFWLFSHEWFQADAAGKRPRLRGAKKAK